MYTIEKVIKSYGLIPAKIEKVTNRVYKVSDGRNTYALKLSKLTENTVSAWEQTYHHASAFHLTNILPVYLTDQSNFYVIMDDSYYYYLTPWIPEGQPSDEEATTNAYEAIGNIHAKTKESISVEMETVLERFDTYRKECSDLQHKLLNYVQLFEQNRFMSPFELQVCTHYHVLVNVLNELDHRVGRFMNELENEEKWNYCLCHGDLKSSHFLHDRHTYLINWEEATYDNAVSDLSILLQRQARNYEQSPAQLAKLFPAYNRMNSLTASEQQLLTIYLLDPSHYISLIDNYTVKSDQQTMIKQTQMLQSAFRQLELGLKWAEFAEYDDDMAESTNESES
ncbi:phosphotransferase [Lentibacillus sp. CBA3610]|uniref:phosphotransferase n=1 Tax=Lentibacillus sp. CBA3610 TaxID=2518176 RepID=UPI0015961889|nr:phosphotransferase [Lentibacillus sp. CBA3610]QKY69589.1 hypothetical protein Len3610_08245 [Lentibacillus sp. CBA3610]